MMLGLPTIAAALMLLANGANALLGHTAQETVARAASAGDARAAEARVAAAPAARADAGYRIGIDDVLAISVWRENDLGRSVQVLTDGNITFPLVGQVRAEGLTCGQLQQKLTELLSRQLREPEVSVQVQEARSQRINVLGAVTHPGMYPLQKPMTVLDALALAGGFRPFAKAGKIFVLRTTADGSTQRIHFDYRKAVLEGKETPSLELRARDTVVVP
ncbi:MAG: polysaccharide export protein [Acidobacteriota bacterium]|nr:polysaccharide export protein [Acidobacteriota bacterium]